MRAAAEKGVTLAEIMSAKDRSAALKEAKDWASAQEKKGAEKAAAVSRGESDFL